MKIVFHLNGTVNKHICHCWPRHNPRNIHQHGDRLTVWCALATFAINGPYFFENNESNVIVNLFIMLKYKKLFASRTTQRKNKLCYLVVATRRRYSA